MKLKQQLNSTEKVLWLLNKLGEPPYELGLSELANELGCAKSGIYKILNILAMNGFVSQHYDTKKYCLGPAVHRLGMAYNEQKVMWGYAEPIMKEINKISQESVYICVRQGDAAVVAYGIETSNALRLHTKLGTTCPIHAGSMGKLMAAFHDQDKIQSILAAQPLNKKTPNTIVDPQELLKIYEKIRTQGFAFSMEENCLGACGIATPIRNKSNEVIAGLSISGPKIRFTKEKIAEWTKLLLWGAREISSRLGYQNAKEASKAKFLVRQSSFL